MAGPAQRPKAPAPAVQPPERTPPGGGGGGTPAAPRGGARRGGAALLLLLLLLAAASAGLLLLSLPPAALPPRVALALPRARAAAEEAADRLQARLPFALPLPFGRASPKPPLLGWPRGGTAAGAVQALAAALRLRTVAGESGTDWGAENAAFRRLLRGAFPLVHRHLAVETLGDGTLLATWRGLTALPGVLFLSHSDVVPAAEAGAWTHPPFAGEAAEGFLWGRGALDVKSSAVGLFAAVERLLGEGVTAPWRTVYLAVGHDEETGGRGAQALAYVLGLRGVALDVIVDEGGFILEDGLEALVGRRPVALVGTAEKLFLNVNVTVTGPGGHSSLPAAGERTVPAIVAAFVERVEATPLPVRLMAPVRDFLAHLAAEGSAVVRTLLGGGLRALPAATGRLLSLASTEVNAMLRSTAAVVRFGSAGQALNVVPTAAGVVVNFRLLPGDDAATALAHLRAIAARLGVADRLAFEVLEGPRLHPGVPRVEPARKEANSTGPHFGLLREAIAASFDDPAPAVVPYLLPGGTDSRHLEHLSLHGTLRFCPYRMRRSDFARIHGVDERIRPEDFERGIEFYKRAVRALAERERDG